MPHTFASSKGLSFPPQGRSLRSIRPTCMLPNRWSTNVTKASVMKITAPSRFAYGIAKRLAVMEKVRSILDLSCVIRLSESWCIFFSLNLDDNEGISRNRYREKNAAPFLTNTQQISIISNTRFVKQDNSATKKSINNIWTTLWRNYVFSQSFILIHKETKVRKLHGISIRNTNVDLYESVHIAYTWNQWRGKMSAFSKNTASLLVIVFVICKQSCELEIQIATLPIKFESCRLINYSSRKKLISHYSHKFQISSNTITWNRKKKTRTIYHFYSIHE